MTRANLVRHIADKTGLTKAASGKVLQAFLASVEEGLVAEKTLAINGFGTFVVETREQRKGRNPRTGASIVIPAAKVVKFRPGKKLKDLIQ